MDIFYVHPSKRTGSAGLRMFRFVEAELRRRGVQRWFMGSKNHADASALFKRIGAAPVETYFSKWIGE
jgi:N-acetylglutamate synthase-like GNAT family acetyltransferase